MAAHRFEDRVNALSDLDWAWWPLLALRPRRDEPLSEARLFIIALVFGSVCAAFSVLLMYLLFGEPLDSARLLSFICIWVALAIYSLDAWLTLRRR